MYKFPDHQKNDFSPMQDDSDSDSELPIFDVETDVPVPYGLDTDTPMSAVVQPENIRLLPNEPIPEPKGFGACYLAAEGPIPLGVPLDLPGAYPCLEFDGPSENFCGCYMEGTPVCGTCRGPAEGLVCEPFAFIEYPPGSSANDCRGVLTGEHGAQSSYNRDWIPMKYTCLDNNCNGDEAMHTISLLCRQ
jgi:hypothetical protein